MKLFILKARGIWIRLQGNLRKKTYPETEKNKRTVPNRSVSTTLFIDQPQWVHNQQFLL